VESDTVGGRKLGVVFCVNGDGANGFDTIPVDGLANGLLVLLMEPKAFVEGVVKGLVGVSVFGGAKGFVEELTKGLGVMGGAADEKTFVGAEFVELPKRAVGGWFEDPKL
jgi:hypothetical protein